jgi:hypothetical protein
MNMLFLLTYHSVEMAIGIGNVRFLTSETQTLSQCPGAASSWGAQETVKQGHSGNTID